MKKERQRTATFALSVGYYMPRELNKHMKTEFLFSAYNRRHFPIITINANLLNIEEAYMLAMERGEISVFQVVDVFKRAGWLPF